jgi:hypothetical protein
MTRSTSRASREQVAVTTGRRIEFEAKWKPFSVE